MSRSLITAICLLIIVFVLVLDWALVFPKFQEWKDTKQEIEKTRAQLQSRQEYFKELKRVSEKLKQHQPALAKIDVALPDFVFLPSLYAYFQTTASQSGLILKGISFSPVSPKGKKKIKKTRGRLNLSGNYSSLIDFLGEIEKSARMFEVKSIGVTSPKGEKKFLSFSINLITYSY